MNNEHTSTGSDAGVAQVALFNKLLNNVNYSVYDRPVADENEPVSVSIKYAAVPFYSSNKFY